MKIKAKHHTETRGFLIRVVRNSQVTFNLSAQLDLSRSLHWKTCYEFELSKIDLKLIVIGHFYARKAHSFDIQETLEIIGQEYSNGGLSAVRAAIGGGIFALFILDNSRSRLLVMTDLLACMPVYYRRQQNGIEIGTSEFDLEENELNRDACIEYIRYGHLMFASAFQRGTERLGPGQILEVDLNNGSISKLTAESYPAYPFPHDRIQDLNEACQLLDKSLSNFFARFSTEQIAAGLSGGYDSRLIAAYTRSIDRHLVTFNNPGTKEVEYARLVAKALGATTSTFNIPADAPSRLADDFVFGMQSMDNLECSHVFALLEALMHENPTYLIDGLLGDTAIGGGFFFKLHGKINPAWSTIFLRDQYDLPIDPAYDWVDHILRKHPRRLPDEVMNFFAGAESEYPFRNAADIINAAIRSACHTHFDGIDMINYRARTSRVFACGPVTFLRQCPVLCPFYDIDVLTTCMSTDTSLRAGDRLYNAFWRYRFPELASIPKESTGGRAIQSDLNYRLSHFRTAIARRISSRFFGTVKAGGDLGSLLSMYLLDSRNTKFFDEVIKKSHDRLATVGLDQFLDKVSKPDSDQRAYLRVISLAMLLSPVGLIPETH